MAECRDCLFYRPLTATDGECQMNGDVPADRDAGRCPSRTYQPKG